MRSLAGSETWRWSITEPLWLAGFRQEARGNKLGTVSLLPGPDFGRSTLQTLHDSDHIEFIGSPVQVGKSQPPCPLIQLTGGAEYLYTQPFLGIRPPASEFSNLPHEAPTDSMAKQCCALSRTCQQLRWLLTPYLHSHVSDIGGCIYFRLQARYPAQWLPTVPS
jgi:hypothetical protein